jgi:hypothetical protein
LRVLLAGVAIAVLAAGAQGQSTFTKIVDTDTPIPGGVGTFDWLGAPALADGNVGFGGGGVTPLGCIVGDGLYYYQKGKISVVADGCTDMPDCPCPIQFVGFSQPALGGGATTFSGAAAYGGCYCRGIYTRAKNSDLDILADWSTPDPAGCGYLSEFFYVSRCGQGVGFSAFTSGYCHAIYRSPSPLLIELVANYDTPIPSGTGDFSAFGFNPTIGWGLIAFTGGTEDRSQWGVYLANVGIIRIANLTTPVPGSTGTFTDFSDRPSTDGGCVAFHARIEGNQRVGDPGIYTNLGGTLRVVADLNTPIPGGVGNFTDFTAFYGPGIDGGRIAFRGLGAGGQEGVYCESNGQLFKVVDLNTKLAPGVTLTNLAIDEQCLDGRRLGFAAFFETGTPHEFYYAIYVAQLPNGG